MIQILPWWLDNTRFHRLRMPPRDVFKPSFCLRQRPCHRMLSQFLSLMPCGAYGPSCPEAPQSHRSARSFQVRCVEKVARYRWWWWLVGWGWLVVVKLWSGRYVLESPLQRTSHIPMLSQRVRVPPLQWQMLEETHNCVRPRTCEFLVWRWSMAIP